MPSRLAATRWECGDQTNVTAFKVYDCDWVGSFLYPTAMKPRLAAHIHTMNKDEYVDGLRLAQVMARTGCPIWLAKDLAG